MVDAFLDCSSQYAWDNCFGKVETPSGDQTQEWEPEPVRLITPGVIPYHEALELQERLWDARRQDQCGDILLVLQHPPVITFGLSGGLEDLRVPVEELQARGVEFCEIDRGGRATFHGPGQLVAYPIIKLQNLDLHGYCWKLEEAALRLLSGWGISASRDERYPGVWAGRNKIAAIGVAVRERVTLHGLALNVNTDLSFFNLMTPCGIVGRGVTSMQAVLGHDVPLAEVEKGFVREFSIVFGRQIAPGKV
jgi:lipoate-protein ligase B